MFCNEQHQSAIGVDLESGNLAQAADAHRGAFISFCASVMDTAEDEIPAAALAGVDGDRSNRWQFALLAFLLRHPDVADPAKFVDSNRSDNSRRAAQALRRAYRLALPKPLNNLRFRPARIPLLSLRPQWASL